MTHSNHQIKFSLFTLFFILFQILHLVSSDVPNNNIYDFIIIGNGLIGSAAAKYISIYNPSSKVAVIGPSEEYNQDSYGAHYDSGRITRTLDADPFWGRAAIESIKRYSQIEQESQIQFFIKKCGHLVVGNDSYINDLANKSISRQFKRIDVKKYFPFLEFDSKYHALFQPMDAGVIDPRQLILAQNIIASKKGTKFFDAPVSSISKLGNIIQIKTTNGKEFLTKMAILTNGAYANTLLKTPLPILLRGNTILRGRIPKEEISKYKNMPTIIFKSNVPTERSYILPPILYPDGHYYIKIGASSGNESMNEPIIDHTKEAITNWYNSKGEARVVEHLKRTLHQIIPWARIDKYVVDVCVTTHTSNDVPIFGFIEDGIFVATGGNGQAAKSSDELGNIVAMMASGKSKKN